jgi:hypothetical protein
MAMQIVIGAMPIGLAAFAVFAAWRQFAGTPQPNDITIRILTLTAIGLAILMFLLTQFGSEVFVRRARARIASGEFELGSKPRDRRWQWLLELGDAGKLFFVYQKRTVYVATLLEFVAFLNVASFMLSGSLVALTAAGLLVLALVALFPTTSRVVSWIDRQLRLLTDARDLAR